jgi:predicted Fe-Mo cluster-binding NifX family protein
MKIAVPSIGANVCQHFGHCENFNLFETENGKIVTETSVPNPGHRPGYLPNFLADQGVNLVIAGGMGGGAVQIFEERNIEIIAGATGNARIAVERYLKGELKSTGEICHEHDMDNHGGKC